MKCYILLVIFAACFLFESHGKPQDYNNYGEEYYYQEYNYDEEDYDDDDDDDDDYVPTTTTRRPTTTRPYRYFKSVLKSIRKFQYRYRLRLVPSSSARNSDVYLYIAISI
jgi:hypothetical protein